MARLSFFTLLLAVALSFKAVPSTHALQGMDLAPPMVKRAEHINLNQRMVRKKRAADDVPIDPIADPTQSTSNPAVVPTTSSTPLPTTQVPPTTQASSTGSPTSTNTVATSTSTTSTSTSTTTSTASSSSSTPSTSTVPQTTTPTISTTQGGASSRTQSTVLITQTAPASQTSDASSQDQNQSFLPQSAVIGIIVTASCIVAGAAIWTIIRKWKFSPSRHFEDRLEPISWEPTQSSGLPHDPTVAALERASSRNGGRRGSLSSNGEHGTRNMTSVNHDQISMAPDFPPPHDFTAGAGGAYGQGAGYVDMHRGPSPAPGAYGAHYETPNPYDGYDYNNQAYGQRRY